MPKEPPFKELTELLRAGDQTAAELVVRKDARRLIGLAGGKWRPLPL